jgi:hypothetical protein
VRIGYSCGLSCGLCGGNPERQRGFAFVRILKIPKVAGVL